MDDNEETVNALECSISRAFGDRDRARTCCVAEGYPPEEALLLHGAELEGDITRQLEHEADEMRAGKRPPEILDFAPTQKPDDE